MFDQQGEDYARIRTLCYPAIDLFFVCYSVVSQRSVEELKRMYVPSVQYFLDKYKAFLLIGTQIDLRNDPDVIKEMEGPVFTYEDGELCRRNWCYWIY